MTSWRCDAITLNGNDADRTVAVGDFNDRKQRKRICAAADTSHSEHVKTRLQLESDAKTFSNSRVAVTGAYLTAIDV